MASNGRRQAPDGERQASRNRSSRDRRKSRMYNPMGNKNEGYGFNLLRKKKIIHQYTNILRQERSGNSNETLPEVSSSFNKLHKLNIFQKAIIDIDRKRKEERLAFYERSLNAKREKEAAIKKNKEKRFQRWKVASRRTSKGQPIFKYQINQILETLEKEADAEKT